MAQMCRSCAHRREHLASLVQRDMSCEIVHRKQAKQLVLIVSIENEKTTNTLRTRSRSADELITSIRKTYVFAHQTFCFGNHVVCIAESRRDSGSCEQSLRKRLAAEMLLMCKNIQHQITISDNSTPRSHLGKRVSQQLRCNFTDLSSYGRIPNWEYTNVVLLHQHSCFDSSMA